MEVIELMSVLSSNAVIASICGLLGLIITLLMCTCLDNKRDNRPKYMGCRHLTEEEVFGPVEKPEIVIVPQETQDDSLEISPDTLANGHLNDSGRNKSATLNRQLPDIPAELPPRESEAHNTYESTSELYATLDDTYSKVPTTLIDRPNDTQSPSLVEIYDPYSCVKDELKSNKDHQDVKKENTSPSDSGYTKVLACNKKGSKKRIGSLTRLGENSTAYEIVQDQIPPVPDKHFDLLDITASNAAESSENQPGQPVSFNSIAMEMIDDMESVNEDNINNAAGSATKELSYTSISVREPLASLKAKQYESYYSVVHEDDTYAQVDSSPNVPTAGSNISAPINLYAEIDASSNSSGYAQPERNENSASNSEVPPAPPTVESLRNITFHSKETSEDVPEGPKHCRSSSDTIDVSQMYATIDKNKKTRKSLEHDPRVNGDQTGLDLQELKQMLNSVQNNSRTPPFPMNLYESTGARPKNFKSDFLVTRVNGIREDIADSGYETVREIKATSKDETYDNLDKNYRLENSNFDPRYNSIDEAKNLSQGMPKVFLDPGYETVFDAILNDKLDSDKLINGENIRSSTNETYYESVEQKVNDPGYETINTLSLVTGFGSFISDQNNHNYETVESLKISNEKLRESVYDTGYEGVAIKKEIQRPIQVTNGPAIQASSNDVNSALISVTHRVYGELPHNTQDNHLNNHTYPDNKIQDYKDR